MTEIIIDTSENVLNADLAPSSVIGEVVQNVCTLLSTFKGQVPFDRGFGLSMDIMDLPPGKAMAKLQIEIIEAIQDYEPRARVINIEFKDGGISDGILVPKVKIGVEVDRV